MENSMSNRTLITSYLGGQAVPDGIHKKSRHASDDLHQSDDRQDRMDKGGQSRKTGKISCSQQCGRFDTRNGWQKGVCVFWLVRPAML